MSDNEPIGHGDVRTSSDGLKNVLWMLNEPTSSFVEGELEGVVAYHSVLRERLMENASLHLRDPHTFIALSHSRNAFVIVFSTVDPVTMFGPIKNYADGEVVHIVRGMSHEAISQIPNIAKIRLLGSTPTAVIEDFILESPLPAWCGAPDQMWVVCLNRSTVYQQEMT